MTSDDVRRTKTPSTLPAFVCVCACARCDALIVRSSFELEASAQRDQAHNNLRAMMILALSLFTLTPPPPGPSELHWTPMGRHSDWEETLGRALSMLQQQAASTAKARPALVWRVINFKRAAKNVKRQTRETRNLRPLTTIKSICCVCDPSAQEQWSLLLLLLLLCYSFKRQAATIMNL